MTMAHNAEAAFLEARGLSEPEEVKPRRPGRRAGTFAWSAAEGIAKQVLSFALSLTVLPFISPHDLGVFSIAFAIVLVLSLIADDPVSEALIQRPHVTEADWNTGFTANLAVACGVVAVPFATSNLIAKVLAEPCLRTVLPVFTVSILIGSFGNIQKSYLARELRFRTVTQVVLAGNLGGGLVALGMAIAGFGYWAMVANIVVMNIVTSVLYWRLTPWKPRLRIDRDSLVSLWRFAGQCFAAHCVLLLRDGALPLVVGFFQGTTAVGYFSLALRISRTLGMFFENLLQRPLFTLISRLHGTPVRSASLLLDVTTVVGALVLPAFTGLALVGSPLTKLVFGAEWAQAGQMLPWLCVIVFGWLTLHVPAVALRAKGDVGAAIRLLAVPTLLDLGIVIALAASVSLKWALVGMAARAVASLPLVAEVMHRRLGVSGASVLSRWTSPLLGLVAMAVCIEALQLWVGTRWLGLAALIAVGALAYALALGTSLLCGDRSLLRALRDIGALEAFVSTGVVETTSAQCCPDLDGNPSSWPEPEPSVSS